MHLETGWRIKAGEAIQASGSIRAGESLSAGEDIRAGDGYGVYAGVNVQIDSWASSAAVNAQSRPNALMSGCWTGPRLL